MIESEKVDTVACFINAKRIEGCSEKTLSYYRQTIASMLSGIEKEPQEIVTEDLRKYLTEYQASRKSSKVTIDNIRRILSSYFSWLEDEDYIVKSPVRRIHKVKTAKVIKETYTDEALEIMRDNCCNVRDLAMIDLLASSGMRVGEMVVLNRDDINFNERECVVFGKGSKERIVYFDARTKIHLQNYLESRTDTCSALFVSLTSPHDRLQIGGVERRLRELGKRLNLPRVHPHKFRRTLATSAIDKGMPIEQVQQLLGHQKIDTTNVNPTRTLSKGCIAKCYDMSCLPTRGCVPEGGEIKAYNGGVRFQNGDTLIARITPCLENGKAAYINILNDKEVAFGSTEYIVFSPVDTMPSSFYYFLIRSKKFRAFALQYMNGSSGRQRVSGDELAAFPLTKPSHEALSRFDMVAKPVLEQFKVASKPKSL